MQSPCILVCSIDDKTGYCFGCGRTRSEIASWTGYSDDQRLTIMAGLAARLLTVETKPRRETRRRQLARQRSQSSSPEENINAGTGCNVCGGNCNGSCQK